MHGASAWLAAYGWCRLSSQLIKCCKCMWLVQVQMQRGLGDAVGPINAAPATMLRCLHTSCTSAQFLVATFQAAPSDCPSLHWLLSNRVPPSTQGVVPSSQDPRCLPSSCPHSVEVSTLFSDQFDPCNMHLCWLG